MASCEVEDAAQFDSATRRWAIPIVLDTSGSSEFVARRSRWFALVDETYPFGEVDLYPSAANGLTATFPHQVRNDRGPLDRAWRSGKLCLDSPIARDQWSGAPRDPVGDSEERLAWYARRAVEWLEAAIAGTLTARGDPFELPWLNTAVAPTGVPSRIVY